MKIAMAQKGKLVSKINLLLAKEMKYQDPESDTVPYLLKACVAGSERPKGTEHCF